MAFFSICAYAEGTGKFLQGCETEGEEIRIVSSSMEPQGGVGEGTSFRVTISGQEVPVTEVATVRQSHMPVTVYCLVDVSGSMKQPQMDEIKEILSQLAKGLEDGDNMVVGTLGNQTETSGFLDGKEQWMETIGRLAAGHEDTNLYAGIVESIGVLEKDVQANPKKCLLILSDGQDDQKSGITQKEAETAIQDSRIPVCTVAVMRDGLSKSDMDSQIEYGKLLGSFARMSVGGEHYAPLVDGNTAEEIADDILSSIKDSLVLTADVSGISSKQDKMLLRAVYSSSDGRQYEDDMELYTEDLNLTGAGEETADAAGASDVGTEDTEPDGTETDHTEPDSTESGDTGSQTTEPGTESFPLWMLIVLAVILTTAAFGILLAKKKRESYKIEGIAEIAEGNIQENAGGGPADVVAGTAAEPEEEVFGNIGSTFRLKLTAVGRVRFQKEILLEENKEVTLGRNDRADIVLNKEDNRLSSCHCTIKWTDGKLTIWDNGSTNGTFVNGVSIGQIGRVAVHEDDILQLGSYEYRVGREQE